TKLCRTQFLCSTQNCRSRACRRRRPRAQCASPGLSPAGSALSIRHGRDTGGVWLEVCDQGPGVPTAQRERIFEPFWSGPPPPGEQPGTGLGLAMALGFAQLMRGELTLEQRQTAGACFRLSWPEPENLS
ncbi:hypothetical protein C3F00_034215, partial [Pseudomonas sp. MWU13-2860]